MNGISNGYIENAIDELVGSLGIKESIGADTLLRLIGAGKTGECIEAMADYLGLPIAVDLQYVPATYQRPGSGGGNAASRFESNALAKTDSAGRGVEAITAQVWIPGDLPFYATSRLKGFRLTVRVSDNCRRHPLTFMAIMAHELSHVLLHSLRHGQKDNEVCTDLAAMVLGFCDVMGTGRKLVKTEDHGYYTQTATTTYGYLADEQFRVATARIRGTLKYERTRWQDVRQRTTKRLAGYRKQVSIHRKKLCELRKLVECIDRNPASKKVRQEDALKVVEVHGPTYIEEIASRLSTNERRLEQAERLYSDRCQNPNQHYTAPGLDSLRALCDSLEGMVSEATNDYRAVSNDVAILRRYVSVFDRLRVKHQVRGVR